jgi:regulator of nucleoside diphosphate kinase
MFRNKTTITRLDRDRLAELTNSKLVGWAMFIDKLQRGINRARVVEPTRIKPNVVTMNSRVKLLDLARDGHEIHTLAYPQKADLRSGRLSVLSPLGMALLGAREGDVVRVMSADGPRDIKIESILYQPEAAGQNEEILAVEEEIS